MISKDYKELVLDLSSSITLMSGGLLIKLNYDLSTNMKGGKNCNCAQKDSKHVFMQIYILIGEIRNFFSIYTLKVQIHYLESVTSSQSIHHNKISPSTSFKAMSRHGSYTFSLRSTFIMAELDQQQYILQISMWSSLGTCTYYFTFHVASNLFLLVQLQKYVNSIWLCGHAGSMVITARALLLASSYVIVD